MPRPPLGLLICLALVPGMALAQEPDPPQVFELPGEQVFPEGIAVDEEAGVFYVGSTTDGTIYRGDLAGGEVTVFAEGAQPTAIGMKLDEAGRLWVAGGPSGQVFVYDTATGALLQSYSTPQAEETFLNDLAVTPSGSVYVTDSFRPLLFMISNEGGELETWLELEGTGLEYQQGFNLNGIAATPDGRFLIVVQSNTGKLYRIEINNKGVSEIDLGGDTVTAGDGILLVRQTLYVVRNAAGQIVPVELSDDYRTGTVGDGFTDPSLMFPTTVAKAGDSLLVVNSQFNNQGGSPVLPFTVSQVAIP